MAKLIAPYSLLSDLLMHLRLSIKMLDKVLLIMRFIRFSRKVSDF